MGDKGGQKDKGEGPETKGRKGRSKAEEETG